ncbi:MAG: hypothetical protein JSS19_15310 [Proteobacteria bacterium]|nr:hypothetical protein [Pseudomonadota bacterium]MBS0610701.1 hypothetical protein [Pseudomonadota bacterium]
MPVGRRQGQWYGAGTAHAACAVVFDTAKLQAWFCHAPRVRVRFTRRQQSYLWNV